jgi:putative transposase
MAWAILVVSDRATGTIKVIETCFLRSARQRCLGHRMKNLVGELKDR